MPIEVTIPGRGQLLIRHVVLDVNGTLATDGSLIEGAVERLARLRQQVDIHLITADTHGGQAAIDARLGLTAHRLRAGSEREQKARLVGDLDRQHCAAVGNGSNDALMLQTASLGIAVLGREGLSIEALRAADVVAASIEDALDLLLQPARLIATLRR